MEHHVNPYRIYLKATRKWVEVSEKYYLDHRRYYDAFRKRHQSHGQCICLKIKFWLCDMVTISTVSFSVPGIGSHWITQQKMMMVPFVH